MVAAPGGEVPDYPAGRMRGGNSSAGRPDSVEQAAEPIGATGQRRMRMPTVKADHAVQLAIGGMTCGSCAARVQRKLNKLDGVTASVNLATATASVAHETADVTVTGRR